jgi:hypothetical protein
VNLAVKGTSLPPVKIVVEGVRSADYLRSVGGDSQEFGDLATPLMFYGPTIEGGVDIGELLEGDPARAVLGDLGWTIVRPPRIGETLHATLTVADVYEREGRKGVSTVAVVVVDFEDDQGELAFSQQATFIERP